MAASPTRFDPHGRKAWVGTDDLHEVHGDVTLDDLTQKTGLTWSKLLTRLSAALPKATDRLIPQRRMPTEDEARILI